MKERKEDRSIRTLYAKMLEEGKLSDEHYAHLMDVLDKLEGDDEKGLDLVHDMVAAGR